MNHVQLDDFKRDMDIDWHMIFEVKWKFSRTLRTACFGNQLEPIELYIIFLRPQHMGYGYGPVAYGQTSTVISMSACTCSAGCTASFPVVSRWWCNDHHLYTVPTLPLFLPFSFFVHIHTRTSEPQPAGLSQNLLLPHIVGFNSSTSLLHSLLL